MYFMYKIQYFCGKLFPDTNDWFEYVSMTYNLPYIRTINEASNRESCYSLCQPLPPLHKAELLQCLDWIRKNEVTTDGG